MEFPHIKDTSFPNLNNVNVYKYQNNFDYARWQGLVSYKLMNVKWNSSYNDVPFFNTKEERDSWFDSQDGYVDNLETLFNNTPKQKVKVPLPFNDMYHYNYLVVDMPVQTSESEPINYGKESLRVSRWFYFIEDMEQFAPSTTELTIVIDYWTTFINTVSIPYLMLERGHAPMVQTSVETFLNNPIANNEYLLADDFNYGGESIIQTSTYQPIGNGKKYVLFCAPFSVSDFSNLSGEEYSGQSTPPTFEDVNNRWGYQLKVNDYEWKYGNVDYSDASAHVHNEIQDGLFNGCACYAIEGSQAYDFFNDCIENCVTLLHGIKAMFILDESMFTKGTGFTFRNKTIYPVQKKINTRDFSFNKSQFGFDSKYANITKLYTFPYSRLEITDDDGHTFEARIENCGNIKMQEEVALVYPFLNYNVFFSGINGAGTMDYVWKNIDDSDSNMKMWASDFSKFMMNWKIPTYSLFVSAEYEYAANHFFDNRAKRLKAILDYTNAVRYGNTTRENTKDSMQTSTDNVAATGTTNYGNTQRSTTADVANTALSGTTNYANTQRSTTANSDNVSASGQTDWDNTKRSTKADVTNTQNTGATNYANTQRTTQNTVDTVTESMNVFRGNARRTADTIKANADDSATIQKENITNATLTNTKITTEIHNPKVGQASDYNNAKLDSDYRVAAGTAVTLTNAQNDFATISNSISVGANMTNAVIGGIGSAVSMTNEDGVSVAGSIVGIGKASVSAIAASAITVQTCSTNQTITDANNNANASYAQNAKLLNKQLNGSVAEPQFTGLIQVENAQTTQAENNSANQQATNLQSLVSGGNYGNINNAQVGTLTGTAVRNKTTAYSNADDTRTVNIENESLRNKPTIDANAEDVKDANNLNAIRTKTATDTNADETRKTNNSNATRYKTATDKNAEDTKDANNTNASRTKTATDTNALNTKDTNNANAQRTQTTETNNATYSRNALVEAEQDKLAYKQIEADYDYANERMKAPAVFGDYSGDFAQDVYKRRGVRFNVRTQPKSSIAQAGDAMLRFGYALHRVWDMANGFHYGNHFTFWKAEDIWINDGSGVANIATNTIAQILLNGVTVWSNPSEIGTIGIYNNL